MWELTVIHKLVLHLCFI